MLDLLRHTDQVTARLSEALDEGWRFAGKKIDFDSTGQIVSKCRRPLPKKNPAGLPPAPPRSNERARKLFLVFLDPTPPNNIWY